MWMETSGGAIVEQDCHGIDVLNWFGGGAPVKAYGTAGLRYPLPYGDWNSDHHNITYTYANGTTGWLISVKHTAGFRDVKERVYGSQGMVELARTYVKWHGPQGDYRFKSADNLSDRSLIEMRESKYDITIDAVKHFFTSVIEGKPFHMTQEAADATFAALLGRMAYEKKREVTMAELMKSA
jgi:predicted dehydrogenase